MKMTQHIKHNWFVILFALTSTLLAPQARAECREGCSTAGTYLGEEALSSNTTGYENTAIGASALKSNTSGFSNTALGVGALVEERTGHDNTAIGGDAMSRNINGNDNTAVGDTALYSNMGGISNVAVGSLALQASMNGSYNTASGYQAMYLNTNGNNNTADGQNALGGNTTGSNNIAVGYLAGDRLTTGNYNIAIGNEGVAAESGVIRLGTEGQQTATFIAGVVTTPLATGAAVGVGITPTGQLGVRPSSVRFKETIKPMDKASEAILSLRPVTFRYKKELDPKGAPQFGLVAEEVAKVDSDLVVPDATGKPFTVRYDEVNAMLLNEFLKEHRKVDAQGAEIAELRAALKEQAEQLHKVSERLDTGALPLRLVENR
jgi:hypothetical protein